jgi:hypothetical protein
MAGSRRSAEVVAPWLIDLVQPASVLDVDCGGGTWLRAFVDAASPTSSASTATTSPGCCSSRPGRLPAHRPLAAVRPLPPLRPRPVAGGGRAPRSRRGRHAGRLDRPPRRRGRVLRRGAVPGRHPPPQRAVAGLLDRPVRGPRLRLSRRRPAVAVGAPRHRALVRPNLFLFVAEGELARDRWAAARDLPTLGSIAAIHRRLHEMWNAVPSPEPAAPDVGPRAHLAAARGHLRELGRLAAALPGSVARALRRRRAARGR